MMKTVALIPAFNEATRVGATIKALEKIDVLDKTIVVDDGSKDGTGDIAKEAGAEVISIERNIGKGKALNYAIEKMDSYDALLLIDADLEGSATEAKALLSSVIDGKADMAIADFPKPKKKGGFGLVKKLARWGIKRCTGLTVKEPLSGQRAITKNVVKSVGKLENGFGAEVGLTIDAARKGFKILEISLPMSHAETGRDIHGFLHRGRQFFATLRVVAKRLVKKGERS